LERTITGLFTRGFPKSLRQRIESYPETYNSVMIVIEKEMEINERNIVLIQPESMVAAGALDNSRESLTRSIEQGYADTCRYEELNSFGG